MSLVDTMAASLKAAALDGAGWTDLSRQALYLTALHLRHAGISVTLNEIKVSPDARLVADWLEEEAKR